jgi:hypothetical protein
MEFISRNKWYIVGGVVVLFVLWKMQNAAKAAAPAVTSLPNAVVGDATGAAAAAAG